VANPRNHRMEQNYHGEGPSWNVEQKQKYVEIERRPLYYYLFFILFFIPFGV